MSTMTTAEYDRDAIEALHRQLTAGQSPTNLKVKLGKGATRALYPDEVILVNTPVPQNADQDYLARVHWLLVRLSVNGGDKATKTSKRGQVAGNTGIVATRGECRSVELKHKCTRDCPRRCPQRRVQPTGSRRGHSAYAPAEQSAK
jgi:hypothetical protein